MVSAPDATVVLVVLISGLAAYALLRLMRQSQDRERVLREAKVAADSTHQAAERRISKLRHDLRTPVAAIIGYSEMLREDAVAAGESDKAADLERIEQAGRQLLAMLDDLKLEPATEAAPGNQAKVVALA